CNEEPLSSARGANMPSKIVVNMFINATIVLASSLLILSAESVALARERGLPSLGFQRQCRVSQGATDATVSRNSTDAFQTCVKSEQAAREQLIKDWATIPASDKASCVRPAIYHPSYFEWLSCIELSRNVRKWKKEHPEPTPSSKLCPFVRWDEDGSIVGVDNCRPGRSL